MQRGRLQFRLAPDAAIDDGLSGLLPTTFRPAKLPKRHLASAACRTKEQSGTRPRNVLRRLWRNLLSPMLDTFVHVANPAIYLAKGHAIGEPGHYVLLPEQNIQQGTFRRRVPLRHA